jgi:hypothetical protein
MRTVKTLTDEQLDELGQTWVHSVLRSDDQARQAGLDNAEFDELGARIESQLSELRPMLARGQPGSVMPAFKGFLHLCGLDARLDPGDEQRAAYTFLQAVVRALEVQSQRQHGAAIRTVDVAPPPPQHVPWADVFTCWRDHVHQRRNGA